MADRPKITGADFNSFLVSELKKETVGDWMDKTGISAEILGIVAAASQDFQMSCIGDILSGETDMKLHEVPILSAAHVFRIGWEMAIEFGRRTDDPEA